MILNYLKIAFRQLLRNRIYLLINTLGMGIAIACAMTSYLLVAYNIEFDSTVDAGRVKDIVKVVHQRKEGSGDLFKELVAPINLGPVATQEIAGIKRFTRFFSDGGYLTYGEKGFHETIFFADEAFMDMFRPKLSQGSYKNFSLKSSIFISERFASKYFGKEPAVGKIMAVQIGNRELQVTVGGVLKEVPFNSSFTEDVLMRAEHYLAINNVSENSWAGGRQASTLFELTDIRQAAVVAQQFQKYVALQNKVEPETRSVHFELVPFLQSIPRNDIRQSDLHLGIPAIALVIFTTIGAIILLIACFNLTNTTLALSMKRLKEIGVRKVVGSSRYQIATQFFIEIAILVTLAVSAGACMAFFLIPQFATMWDLPYGLNQLSTVNFVLALVILLIFSTLLAGIYPALYSSRLSPVTLFKGQKHSPGTNLFTRCLLVGQFSLSIIVMIAGTFFTQNSRYQNRIDFGYDKDMIITALIQGPQEAYALRNVLLNNPDIESVSPSVHHFAFINGPQRQGEIASEKFNATVYEVNSEYFKTVGLALQSGRIFNERDTSDNTILVDVNFVTRHRLADPIESKVSIEGKVFTIIGVVDNHLTDLESYNTENYIYKLANPKQYQILVIRARPETLKATQHYVDAQWQKLFPGKPLRTDLQQDILYHEVHAFNDNLSEIFLFMTVLGCILSISGLYSMASLNIHRRTKEIGVRKILGASIRQIMQLINGEFAIILAVAACLGGAGGYYFTEALMAEYAQHIEITAMPVILCGIFVFIIGLSTTCMMIWRTADANPVNALKVE